jgi:hypothetical protein
MTAYSSGEDVRIIEISSDSTGEWQKVPVVTSNTDLALEAADQVDGTSWVKRAMESIRETIFTQKEQRRKIDSERQATMETIREETEINRHYIKDQTQTRKRRLEGLLNQYKTDSATNMEDLLMRLTDLTLAPLATIEFPESMQHKVHEEQKEEER